MNPASLRGIYVRQQVFVLGFGLGIVGVGIGLLLYPHSDITTTSLPEWMRAIYHAGYLLGGGLLAIGVFLPSARMEASGHVVVSSLFIVSLILTLNMAANFEQAATSILFILPLSIGSACRAFFLIRLTHA